MTPDPSPSSSSTTRWTFDVFLSFRGEDTRYGFVDHLHNAFNQRGFIVFKDDKKLEQGSTIAEELFKAIKESQYAVVVISKTFAESKWCLNELSEILRCKRESGLTVLPIFYHVDPADVRKQKGIFAKAFAKHQEDPEVDGEKMKVWRAVLKEVADMVGTHVQHNSPEAIIVEQITTTIFHGLQLNPSEIFKDFVGIKSRVEELKSLLCLQTDDVRFIGIHGMGGIGKTTLARALYNYVHCEFNASSFVCCGKDQGSSLEKLQQQIFHEILKENNREISNHFDGVEKLRQRLRNKKVFIVFDDVNYDQLKALAGSPSWFGKGSKIVITGRDSKLWKPIVSEGNIYEVDPLGSIDALELFCRKAFNPFDMENDFGQLFQEAFSLLHGKAIYEYGFNMENDFVKPLAHVLRSLRYLPCGLENDFAQLSVRAIRSVGYLPLGLEVIGSLLHDEKIDVWKSTLNDLECLENDVFSKLRISYNGLNELQKEMFLDITCFFVGGLKLKIQPIFESLGYNPTVNFEVLKKKSLIKISSEGMIWMHDLLREMGQRIVNQFSLMEPGNRSRLWSNQEIICVIKNNSGTSAIKGIVTKSFKTLGELNYEAFSKMEKLTILIIMSFPCWSTGIPEWHSETRWVGNQSNLILSNELRVLKWREFPLKSLPESFQPDNLVKLSIKDSNIKVLWHGKKTFNRLKSINLSGSKDLIEIPDLSEAPNLETLKFRSCESLKKVHPSIGILKKLLFLDLLHCKSLERLPEEIYWESLVHLNLGDCERLENFPKNMGIMTSLKFLNLERTQPPHFCQFIESYPSRNPLRDWLSSLTFVQYLNLGNCKLLDEEILNEVSSLSSLQYLYLEGHNFTKLPDSFYLLSQLELLDINNWSQLQTLPKLPLSLSELEIPKSPDMGSFEFETVASVWFSVTTDGTPYKILQLDPQLNPNHLSPNESESYDFNRGNMFAWGPVLGCEVPDWFDHKCADSFRGDVDLEELDLEEWDLEELVVGIALFVAYQVGEHENLTCGTSGGSNPTSLEFTCQFEAFIPPDRDMSDKVTCPRLVCRVPEVPLVGLNGFWALVPAKAFHKNYWYFRKHFCFKASIKSSWNGEAMECKSRCLHKQDVSEFFDVLDSISPQGLKLKNLQDISMKIETW